MMDLLSAAPALLMGQDSFRRKAHGTAACEPRWDKAIGRARDLSATRGRIARRPCGLASGYHNLPAIGSRFADRARQTRTALDRIGC